MPNVTRLVTLPPNHSIKVNLTSCFSLRSLKVILVFGSASFNVHPIEMFILDLNYNSLYIVYIIAPPTHTCCHEYLTLLTYNTVTWQNLSSSSSGFSGKARRFPLKHSKTKYLSITQEYRNKLFGRFCIRRDFFRVLLTKNHMYAIKITYFLF